MFVGVNTLKMINRLRGKKWNSVVAALKRAKVISDPIDIGDNKTAILTFSTS